MKALKKALSLLKANWKTTLVGIFFAVFGIAYFFKLIDAQGLTMVWGALGGVGFTISKDA
jgi:MFS superfamily sulfate permease-like transporter